MPSKSKKVFIKTEKREVVIARKRVVKKIIAFCDECKKESEFTTLETATLETNIKTLEIVDLIEKKLIHWTEKTNGILLICRNSIEKIREK
jgi:uncharacterized beta-barrel protein YwiB (DUF1934 family)